MLPLQVVPTAQYMSAMASAPPPLPPRDQPLVRFEELPACTQCRWFRAAEGTSPFRSTPVNPYLAKCTKFGTKNIITGQIQFLFAIQSRSESDKCGFEGNHFVPVYSPPPPPSTLHILAQMYENMDRFPMF